MCRLSIVMAMLVCAQICRCSPVEMQLETERCETLDPDFLRRILGSAFNPRYMSLLSPPDKDDEEEGESDKKRNIQSYRPFSVDASFTEEVEEDTPAWDVDHFDSDRFSSTRAKRSTNTTEIHKRSIQTPWECKSVIKWIDLGRDYFPRYLRNVECIKHDCWYGRFQCRAKSFTVKLLRRKNGRCAYKNRKTGSVGVPHELRELWVWEERAVNFCCECAPKD